MRRWWFLFILFWLLPFVMADFEVSDENMKKSYIGGERFSGTLNVSVNDESSEGVFRDSYGNNMTLLELLEGQGAVQDGDYNCTTRGCVPVYKRAGSSSSEFDLEGEKIIGFSVSGRDVVINEIDFLLTSDASTTCSRQIEIEVLGNNESKIYNTQPDRSGPVCSNFENGCFDEGLESSDYTEVSMSDTFYCNEVSLFLGPSYRVRANINADNNETPLDFELFDESLFPQASCSAHFSSTGDVSPNCILNFSKTTTEKHFVCVSAPQSENYKIKFEQKGDICGGAGIGKRDSGDYNLEIASLRYDTLEEMSMEKALTEVYSLDLADEVDHYISEVYGRDCSNSCSIPFVISGGNQKLSVTNVSLEYVFEGNEVVDNNIYTLEEEIPKIGVNGEIEIDMSKTGFSLPLNTKKTDLSFWFDDDSLLKKSITLDVTQGFIFDIFPKTVLLGIETFFIITNAEEIIDSKWDFGDGKIKDISGNSTSHRFLELGTFNISVEARSYDDVSIKKEFEIVVENPKKSAETLFNETSEKLDRLETQSGQLPTQLRDQAKISLNLEERKSNLDSVKGALLKASSDEEYVAVVKDILAIDVPKSIFEGEKGIIDLTIGYNSINQDYLSTYLEEEISENRQDDFLNNLLDWNVNKHSSTIEFSKLTIRDSSDDRENLAVSYTINFVSENELGYLIIDYPAESIVFDGEAKPVVSSSSSGSVIEIGDLERVTFLITEDIDPEDLGMYLAPKELSVLGKYLEEDHFIPIVFPKGKLITWIVLLVVGFFVIYIILQEWYKKRYEHYLFSNPDDLYNLITFIQNSRNSGLTDSESMASLRKSSWHGEQLRYAFRKIDGKRTGMFEIPIFSFFERRKVQKEIAKRQGRPGDGRFIKRSSF